VSRRQGTSSAGFQRVVAPAPHISRYAIIGLLNAMTKNNRGKTQKTSFSNVVAIIALLLSIVSIGVSIWNSHEQKRQWQAVSMGRVDVIAVSFIYWQIYSEDEIRHPVWGYKVDLMPLLENNQVLKNYGLPSRLIAYDPVTKHTFPETAALTLQEFTNKLKSSPGLPQSVVPVKQYQLQWTFQNVGSTAVTDFRISIDYKKSGSEKWENGQWGQPAELGPGRTVLRISDLTSPIEASIPPKLSFRARLEYVNFEKQTVTRTIPVYFDAPTGAFNFGE
jgi:hypothetical protein